MAHHKPEDRSIMPTRQYPARKPSDSAKTASPIPKHESGIGQTEENIKTSWMHLFVFVERRHAGLVVSAIASAMAVAGSKTFYAIVLGKIFGIVSRYGAGHMNGDDTLAGVTKWCIILTVVGVAIWVANAAFMALWIIFGEIGAMSARNTLFAAMLRKDMSWFDAQGDGLSSLLVRIQGQTRELQTATSQVLGYLVCDVFLSIACLAVAFYFSWKLSLVLLATIPISVLALSLISRPLEPAIKKQKAALSQASRLANAAITAIDLVKVYNGSDQEIWQYLQSIRAIMKHYLVQALCNCLQMSYIKFWMINLFVVGFWFAVYLVNRGEITPGNALTTFYAALTAFEAIESVGPQWLVLAKGMSAGQSLQAIARNLQGGRQVRKLEGQKMPDTCSGDIEVNDVTFSYPSNPSATILNHASFFFPAGEICFLVGRSGSGKSTIGNLLLKFYERQGGDILVDGHPLQTLDAHWVRNNITLIQQSSILFQSTFFMNVALGHRDPEHASKAEVKNACEAALLQSTIAALPDGLNTMLGPGGQSLSGGQKQRLALARARLRDPPVLILDEVTSGLDPVSKSMIMDAIRLWRKGKTTIIITHEVSQIQDQEYVYVLDRSAVVQEGFKRDIMQERGMFTNLLSSLDDWETESTSEAIKSALDTRPSSPMFPLETSRLNRMPFHRLSIGMTTAQLAGHRAQDSRILSYRAETASFKNLPGAGHVVSNGADVQQSRMLSQKAWLQQQLREGEQGQDAPFSRSSFEVVQETGDTTRARRSQNNKGFQAKGLLQSSPSICQASPNEKIKGQEGPSHNGSSVRQLSTPQIIGTVWPVLDGQDRLLCMLGLAFCLLVAACNPAFAFVFAKLLQSFWAQGDRLVAGQKWAIYLTIIAAIDAASGFIAHYFMERTAQVWVNNLRVEALKRVLSQPRSWFDEPANSSSRITECLDKNAEEMRNLVGRFLPIIVMVVAMLSSALIWALVISWKLTLVALSAGPAVYAATWASSAVSDKWEAKCHSAAESTSGIFSEVFTNIRVVKALTQEPLFTSKHMRSTTSTFRLGVKRGLFTGIFFGLYQSMSFWLTALVFWYGTTLLRRNDGGIPVADILQVINLLLFSMGTATMMLGSLPQISQAKVAAAQLLHYASLSHDSNHETHGRRRTMTPFPIRMTSLQFAYPSRPTVQVLRNVTLRIDAGDCIAIVGSSGCGKSTIASILLRLYEPSNSNDEVLTFARVPSRQLDTAVLRSMMAYVPQQPFLFPASVRENIVYGLHEDSPLRDINNVTRAAQAAGIHDIIASLPDGYQTMVGEGGLVLSGGQTQRVSIARALARKPKLLVLDEPTSALDAQSAEEVRDTIKRLMARPHWTSTDVRRPYEERRMAVVMVTHSKEAMLMADRIVVIDEGRVVEEGAYSELIAKRGKFAELMSGGAWMNRDHRTGRVKSITNMGDPSQSTSQSPHGHNGWTDNARIQGDPEDIAPTAQAVAAAREEAMQPLERPRSAV